MEALAGLLNDYTFRTVAFGSALLGLVSGVLGCFAVLRRQSLLGDGVAHSTLPGVVAVFLLTGVKQTEILLLGALISGLLATLFILGIIRHTRVKFDSALALVMSVFFGLGMVLLAYAQKIPNSNQAGLSRFIFGQASTLLERDILLTAVCGVLLLIPVLLLWKEFKLISFDPDFALSIGFKPKLLNLLLSAMTVLAIVIGLHIVGVVLMSAMLITPAVAARQWTDRLWVMVLLSALIGAASGAVGTIASSLSAKLPTGPAIVICASFIALVSILFAPRRGVAGKLITRAAGRAACRKAERSRHAASD